MSVSPGHYDGGGLQVGCPLAQHRPDGLRTRLVAQDLHLRAIQI